MLAALLATFGYAAAQSFIHAETDTMNVTVSSDFTSLGAPYFVVDEPANYGGTNPAWQACTQGGNSTTWSCNFGTLYPNDYVTIVASFTYSNPHLSVTPTAEFGFGGYAGLTGALQTCSAVGVNCDPTAPAQISGGTSGVWVVTLTVAAGAQPVSSQPVSVELGGE